MPENSALLRALSYPRSVIATVLMLLWTLIICVLIVLASFVCTRRSVFSWIQRWWAKVYLWLFNVQVVVEHHGAPFNQGCLYIFNHTSQLDIPILYSVLPRDPRFGAKAELFKIPVFGSALRKMGILPIARRQREEVLKLYQESITRVHQGESFILAPEGTRTQGPELGAFKSGPFIFAISGQFPIVPVVIVGAHRIQSRSAWFASWGVWRSEIKVIILPAVETKGWVMGSRTELQEKIRTQMIEAHPLLDQVSPALAQV